MSFFTVLFLLLPLNLLQVGGIFDSNVPGLGAIGFPVEFLIFNAQGVRSFQLWGLVVDVLLFCAIWGVVESCAASFRRRRR